ncbi:Cytochrome P450 716B1 [Dichanthelium oligosanthes]|uniref:Cytochrome P450 716B1 n=1 Tax=Dichanthelium oligosanthes TaxID=888268 RepID=A0A1E5VDG9_9POAL|nr:Cytochrome P450 716B1 [Dichanthelium oligosanthes]
MDAEVRRHLDAEWRGRGTVAVMPSMKSLTFDVMCTLIFGLGSDGDTAVRRERSTEFQKMMRGLSVIPLDLPFTAFRNCLPASRRGRRAVAGVIEERRAKLARGESSPTDDVVTHMLVEGLPVDEIIDNVMFLMIAAHDTTASLLTFLIRHLDANRDAYAKVLKEEIARCKEPGEALSWDDLGRMRYTWAAALETLRLVIQALNLTQWDLAVFPEPGRFDPARFENPSAVLPFSFVAFGGGARVCPGNNFATVETLVAMHYIVTRFRWKLAAGCDASFSGFPLPYPSQGLLIDLQTCSRGFLVSSYYPL